jgi:hypothetical protein
MPVDSFAFRTHAHLLFICVINSVVRNCLKLSASVRFIRSVDVWKLQTQSCDRCGNTKLSHLLIQVERMSALSLMSHTQYKPKNCGSVLHVGNRFINHLSEVSSRTLGNSLSHLFNVFQQTVHRPGRTVKLTVHPQAKNESSCRSIPP